MLWYSRWRWSRYTRLFGSHRCGGGICTKAFWFSANFSIMMLPRIMCITTPTDPHFPQPCLHLQLIILFINFLFCVSLYILLYIITYKTYIILEGIQNTSMTQQKNQTPTWKTGRSRAKGQPKFLSTWENEKKKHFFFNYPFSVSYK